MFHLLSALTDTNAFPLRGHSSTRTAEDLIAAAHRSTTRVTQHRTSVDVVTTSEVSVSVTIDDTRHLPAIISKLEDVADVTFEENMAVLCAVGEGLKNDPSFVAHLLDAVGAVPIRMLSLAAARRNITLVIREQDLEPTLKRVHQRFLHAQPSSRLDPHAAASPAEASAKAER